MEDFTKRANLSQRVDKNDCLVREISQGSKPIIEIIRKQDNHEYENEKIKIFLPD